MTRLAAFAFSELIEASATLASLGEARSEAGQRAYLEVVRSAIAAADGRTLETVGDGVLAVFESPSDALSFASGVQRGCERAARRIGERLDVRLGIDVGESVFDETRGGEAISAAVRARQLARVSTRRR